MSLYQQAGYKRLAIGISVGVFVLTLIVIGLTTDLNLAEALIPTVIASIGAFALTCLTYWIIDGFRSQ